MTCPQDHFSTNVFILTNSVSLTPSQYQKPLLIDEEFTFPWWECGGGSLSMSQEKPSTARIREKIVSFRGGPSCLLMSAEAGLKQMPIFQKGGLRLQWLIGSTQTLCNFLLEGVTIHCLHHLRGEDQKAPSNNWSRTALPLHWGG